MFDGKYYVYEVQESGTPLSTRNWHSCSKHPIGNATPRWDDLKAITKKYIEQNTVGFDHFINGEPGWWTCLPFGFLACMASKYGKDITSTYCIVSEVQIDDCLYKECADTSLTFRRVGRYATEYRLKNIPDKQ